MARVRVELAEQLESNGELELSFVKGMGYSDWNDFIEKVRSVEFKDFAMKSFSPSNANKLIFKREVLHLA